MLDINSDVTWHLHYGNLATHKQSISDYLWIAPKEAEFLLRGSGHVLLYDGGVLCGCTDGLRWYTL